MSSIVAHHQSAVATIAVGQQNSSSVDIHEFVAGSFQFPAAMDGTGFNIQVSNDETNWTDLDDSDVDSDDSAAATLTYTFAASEVRKIHDDAFRFKHLRFRSQAAEDPALSINVFLKGHG